MPSCAARFRHFLLVIHHPEMLFVLFALLFGSLSALLTPPFQAPYEYNHFQRAYAISLGQPGGTEVAIPTSIQKLAEVGGSLSGAASVKYPKRKLIEYMRTPLEPEVTVLKSLYGVHSSSIVPYLPQAYGLKLARLLQLPPFWLVLAGRLVNLFVFTVLGLLGLWISPGFKWVLGMLLVLPMSLFLGASFSPDALAIGLSALFFGLGVRFIFGSEKRIPLWQWALALVLILLLGQTKANHSFLGLFLLALPRGKFGSTRTYLLMMALVVGVALAGFGSRYLSGGYASNHVAWVDPPAQIALILHQPGEFLWVIAKTIDKFGWLKVREFIGILGWLDTNMPLVWYTLTAVFFGMVVLLSQPEVFRIAWPVRVWSLAVFLLNAAFIFAAMFIFWTPTGQPYITGIQGRYFLPLAAYLAPALSFPFFDRLRLRVQPCWRLVYALYLFVLLIVMLVSLVTRFYHFQ